MKNYGSKTIGITVEKLSPMDPSVRNKKDEQIILPKAYLPENAEMLKIAKKRNHKFKRTVKNIRFDYYDNDDSFYEGENSNPGFSFDPGGSPLIDLYNGLYKIIDSILKLLRISKDEKTYFNSRFTKKR